MHHTFARCNGEYQDLVTWHHVQSKFIGNNNRQVFQTVDFSSFTYTSLSSQMTFQTLLLSLSIVYSVSFVSMVARMNSSWSWSWNWWSHSLIFLYSTKHRAASSRSKTYLSRRLSPPHKRFDWYLHARRSLCDKSWNVQCKGWRWRNPLLRTCNRYNSTPCRLLWAQIDSWRLVSQKIGWHHIHL